MPCLVLACVCPIRSKRLRMLRPEAFEMMWHKVNKQQCEEWDLFLRPIEESKQKPWDVERWGVINIKRGWLGNPVDGHFEGKIIELNEGWPQQTMLYYMMLQDPACREMIGNGWKQPWFLPQLGDLYEHSGLRCLAPPPSRQPPCPSDNMSCCFQGD